MKQAKGSLPIMGVDGSFTVGGFKESPANKVWAKTGTTINDYLHGELATEASVTLDIHFPYPAGAPDRGWI